MNASAKCQTVTVFSHKDKRQRPCYVQRPQKSTKLATKKNRKENEAEDENQGGPSSSTTAATGRHTYEAAILLMNR